MRHYFRQEEERCGHSGSQMWALQGIQRYPEIRGTELSSCKRIHQSTCSQLVEKMAACEYLKKINQKVDQRRVGFCLTQIELKALADLPGPAEGVLPEALIPIPNVALQTLYVNISELIRHLPGENESFTSTPLADIAPSKREKGSTSNKFGETV